MFLDDILYTLRPSRGDSNSPKEGGKSRKKMCILSDTPSFGQVLSSADPVVPPDLVDGTAGIGFFEDADNLGLGELRLTHGNLLAWGDYSARKFSTRTVSNYGKLTPAIVLLSVPA